MRRPDLVITVLIVGLAAFAVAGEFDASPPGDAPDATTRRLELGEALDGSIVLADLAGEARRVGDLFGARTTVFYAWSTVCPCIPVCEPRLRRVQDLFGAERGVRWVAVAGEPEDDPSDVRDLLARLEAEYETLLDPGQRLCRRLGFDRAGLLAVVDADGYLLWRGTQTDDLRNPTRDFLREALESVLSGGTPPRSEGEAPYGCEFSAPPEDCEDLLPKASPEGT